MALEDFTEEEIRAAAWQIRKLRFAQDKFPDMEVGMVNACGCVGPLPDCPCAVRNRLIDSFLERVGKPY